MGLEEVVVGPASLLVLGLLVFLLRQRQAQRSKPGLPMPARSLSYSTVMSLKR